MKPLEERIVELLYNPHMGGNQCMYYWDEKNGGKGILYIDKSMTIKVGDLVRIERDGNGGYKKIFVNGKLKG